MNVKEIILGGSGVLVVIMTLVQIAPVKINPWSWLARKFGRAINGEVLEKVDRLEKDVTKMKQDADERAAVACRVRILHFGDETLHGVLHSKDHFAVLRRPSELQEQHDGPDQRPHPRDLCGAAGEERFSVKECRTWT